MQRLQSKVRDFIKIEKDLRRLIKDVEIKDQNLVEKLEDAACFGKVLFVVTPFSSQVSKQVEKRIKVNFWREYRARED